DPAMNHLEDFDAVPNLERFINFDPIESLRRMATADALILSHSSFSYLPAILNQNCIVIYHPYWRSPMKDWLISDDNGTLPESDLVKRLESWKRAAICTEYSGAVLTAGTGSPVAEVARRATLELKSSAIDAPLQDPDAEIESLLQPFLEQSAPIR